MLRFSGAGVSDVGRRRPHNEDAAFVGPYVAVVADGVGGAAAGEIASATAAYVVSATALARCGEAPEQVVRDATAAARECVRRGVAAEPARLGMATTMTCALTWDDRIVLGHVGDSRAYTFSGGELPQVSRDHTYVQALVDEGRLTRAGAATHPWRNVVVRAIDSAPVDDPADVDVTVLDLGAGERLLLCSDGLTDLVDDGRIAEVLRLAEPGAAAAVLTQSALLAGGHDNITCVVLDVVDGPVVVGDGAVLGALRDLANIVDPAAVHLAR